MITALLWAIAIGVWLLVLIAASAVGRARRVAARLATEAAAWAQAQEQQNTP